MQHEHQPREQFVAALDRTLTAEVRRRNQLVASSPWLLRSRMRVALAAATLVLMSMAIGGGVVATAFQAQAAGRRNAVLASYEARLSLATQRLDLVKGELQRVERRIAVGVDSDEAAFDARLKVREAEAQVQLLQLQIAEIGLSGAEPLDDIAAPLVGGRNFVRERLEVGLTLPAAALEFENLRLQRVERKVRIGVAQPHEIDLARANVREFQAALAAIQKKLEIRRAFVSKQVDADVANLRVLESEAEQRRAAFGLRLELAERDLRNDESRFQKGLLKESDVMAAKVQVIKLQLELAQADAALARIRQRIRK